jgi:hypothetical protein
MAKGTITGIIRWIRRRRIKRRYKKDNEKRRKGKTKERTTRCFTTSTKIDEFKKW